MYGFMGKILIIDLTTKTFQEISKDETFYRNYLGGSFLCARLFEENLKEVVIDLSSGPPEPEAAGALSPSERKRRKKQLLKTSEIDKKVSEIQKKIVE